MSFTPIPSGGIRSIFDLVQLHQPDRGAPDLGAEPNTSHIHDQENTTIKPGSMLSQEELITNRNARLIPDRGKESLRK